jgi:hypothetical protein
MGYPLAARLDALLEEKRRQIAGTTVNLNTGRHEVCQLEDLEEVDAYIKEIYPRLGRSRSGGSFDAGDAAWASGVGLDTQVNAAGALKKIAR